MDGDEDKRRLSQVEREVSVIKERQAATEQRLDRIQEGVAEAKASAHRDSQQVRQELQQLRDSEIKPMRAKLDQYIERAAIWQGGRSVASWIGWAAVIILAGLGGAWIGSSADMTPQVIQESAEESSGRR